MNKIAKTVIANYPFTFPGSVMFTCSIYFLGRGFSSSSFTSVSVSMFFLVFVTGIWGFTFFYSRSCYIERVIWKSEGDIDSTGFGDNRQMVSLSGSSPAVAPPMFTRYAMIIKGKALAPGGVMPLFYCRYRSDRRGLFNFSFYFPYPGTVSGILDVYIEDIFALVRVRVFTEKLKDFCVLPGIAPDVNADFRFLMKDMIARHKKYDNDTEKYLMREYVPGDLYRDINWKSSGRIDKLVTRISPGGREEANLLTFIYLSARGTEEGRQSFLPSLSAFFNRKAVLPLRKGEYERFVTGKLFREYFYTFIQRLKTDAENKGACELHIIIDGEKCVVKEKGDFRKAARLLALSASAGVEKQTDIAFLSDIPQGSNLCIFAESTAILNEALKKLTSDKISACCIPYLSYSREVPGCDYIPCREGSFVLSSLYTPFTFYSGFLRSKAGAMVLFSPKKSIFLKDGIPKNVRVKDVAIIMNADNREKND